MVDAPLAMAGDSRLAAVRITVLFTGRVQGVGFRATTQQAASQCGVTGWVRNERDGRVLCVAEGEPATIERFLDAVRRRMAGCIQDEQAARSGATGEFSGFEIRR